MKISVVLFICSYVAVTNAMSTSIKSSTLWYQTRIIQPNPFRATQKIELPPRPDWASSLFIQKPKDNRKDIQKVLVKDEQELPRRIFKVSTDDGSLSSRRGRPKGSPNKKPTKGRAARRRTRKTTTEGEPNWNLTTRWRILRDGPTSDPLYLNGFKIMHHRKKVLVPKRTARVPTPTGGPAPTKAPKHKKDPEPKKDPESKTDLEPKKDPETKIDPKPKTDPETKIDPEPKKDSETKIDPKPKTDPETKIDPEPKTDLEPKKDPETKIDPKPKTDPETKIDPEPKKDPETNKN
ncbi:hypothetical protein M8J76_004310 [Diaphorina citri]|nr:hypothetical protein M8J76_004310 [Diaphorina citri]